MKSKAVLAFVLSLSLLTTACTDSWIKVALADLPVLLQMGLNIGTLVTTLKSGKPLSPSDITAAQNVSAEATKDLNLLDKLYQDYKANPSQGTLAAIENAIADADKNLPSILQASHIENADLSARLTAAVKLILDTVGSFAALIPAPAHPSLVAMKARVQASGNAKPPKPNDLKKQWNDQVAPQFKVSGGFWSGLGNAVGEAKWGGQ
jgi:hypothetical protein